MNARFVRIAVLVLWLLVSTRGWTQATPSQGQSAPVNPLATPVPAPPQNSQPQADAQKLADTLKQTAATAAQTLQDAQTEAQKLAGKMKDAGDTVSKEIDKDVDTITKTLTKRADDLAAKTAEAKAAAQELQDAVSAYKKAKQRTQAHAARPPLGDYVPCLFDDHEGLDLRARPSKSMGMPFSSDEMTELTQSLINILTPAAGAAQPADQAAVSQFEKDLKDTANSFAYLPQQSVVAAILKQAALDQLTDDQIKQLTAFLKTVTDMDTYDRPTDVSCSFSVLQYKETKDNFGRRVADQYVGLEVNIRNLNKQNEFLIHDIQIAVDTGLTSWEFGRFQASRDKQVVRGVVQHDEDVRNGVLTALQTIGAILNPINAAVAQTIGGKNSDPAINLGIGVGVFQGPIIAGVTSMWPDRTVDHLNHLNDLGFSPSTTSKTVVPVQGSVPLVTFLAEKPLEQLPFVRCGAIGLFGHSATNRKNDEIKPKPAVRPEFPNTLNCQLHPSYKFEDVDYDDTLTGNFQKPLAYKSWSGAAMNIFEHRVFVVVGGVHIQELSNTATVDKVNCPEVSDQTIDLSQADSAGNISCTISGSNLNQVASIKLEQGKAKTVTGTAAPSGDGNSATIGFSASQFNGVTGSFELFLTTSASQDIDAKQALSFGVRAVSFPNIAGAALAGSVAGGVTVTVGILNPDRIQTISLVSSNGKADAAALPSSPISTAPVSETLTFSKDVMSASGMKVGDVVHLEFVSKDDASGAQPTKEATPTWTLK